MKYCKFAKHIKNMVQDCLICGATGKPCAFQRYCIDYRTVIHTEDAVSCKLRGENDENRTN